MNDEQIRKSMTSEQIQLERKLTCETIDGAIAFGYQNTNPPPGDDHWLAQFWKIGRKQAELELLSVNTPAVAIDDRIANLELMLSGERGQVEIWKQRAQEWCGKHSVLRAMLAAAPTAPLDAECSAIVGEMFAELPPAAPTRSGEPVAWQQRCLGGDWENCSEESARRVEGCEGFEVRALCVSHQPSPSVEAGETFAEFGKARARFLSGEPVGMSERTRELARQALAHRDNDTRSEEEKIQAAAAFICDTRLDLPVSAVALDDERAQAIDAAKDKWKIVDGDCREGTDGLITYHVDAFNEGIRLARAALPQAPHWHGSHADPADVAITSTATQPDEIRAPDVIRGEDGETLNLGPAMSPFGMLVRALRIVAGTTLYDMAKHLSCTSAMLSAVEFGRQPVTDAMVDDAAAYFSGRGIPDTQHALKVAAHPASGDDQ